MATHRVRSGKVSRRTKVLFDSSFLIAVMEHPTPWLEDIAEKLGGFRPVVIGPVYQEIDKLASSKNRASRFASLARDLVARGDLVKEESAGHGRADDELISTALGSGALVATVDAQLLRQLKALGVRTITLAGGRVSF